MRIIDSVFIFGLVLFLSSCSYNSKFYAINNSSQPILVKYRIKRGITNADNLFYFATKPVTISINDLDSDPPHELTQSQFEVNKETRTIIVNILPNEALLVEPINHNTSSEGFHFEEISISGSKGEIHFSDEQARLAFVKNKNYFSLTYK
jgi:hypothetical protein